MVLKRPIGRLRAAVPAVAFFAVLAWQVDPPRHSGNVWSRYMTIESIVERGTLAIGESPLLLISGSPDLAKFGGRLYSDKPPVLPAIASVVYLPMERAGYRMAESPASFIAVNRVLVLVFVALPSAFVLYALRRMMQAVDVSRWLADAAVLGGGFGSLLFVYGVTFNNHSPAAALITAGFGSMLLQPTEDRPRWRRSGVVGLLLGLAATIDLPAGGAVWLGGLIWMAVRSRRSALGYLAGTAGPLLMHCVLQSLVTGTPLPVEMYPEALGFEGSYWESREGTFVEGAPRARFLVELLIGPQGWLTMTPALIFAPVGIVASIARRRDAIRAGAIVVGAVVAVLLLYYSFGVRRTDFAGLSFGVRHLLPITPLVFFYATAAFERLRSGAWRIVFGALVLIGMAYGTLGMLDPWSRAERRPEVPMRFLQQFVLYPFTSYDR